MNKYNLPLKLPAGTGIYVTQGFGPTNNTLEPNGPQGQANFHYGIDLTWGDSPDVFGTELVLPAPNAVMTSELQPPQDYNNTPYVQFSFTGSSGNKYDMVLAHVSKIIPSDKYVAGQTVALAGNYGKLQPIPTPDYPYGGSHLHLGLKCNGEWVDPEKYFDVTKYFIGPKHPLINLQPRAQWALDQIETSTS